MNASVGQPGYLPYCGGCSTMQRMTRKEDCFECHFCGLKTRMINGEDMFERTAPALPLAHPAAPQGEDIERHLEAADYLIDLCLRLWRGEPVRDLAEATASWKHSRAALAALAPAAIASGREGAEQPALRLDRPCGNGCNNPACCKVRCLHPIAKDPA